MKLNMNFIFNFLIFVLVMALCCGFQTSFWFQLFGNVPAPLLWINIVIYIALYRKPQLGIWVVYALGFVAAAFSAIPLKMVFITLLLLFGVIYAVKSRVFWSGSGYYTIMSIFGAIMFHIIYFICSWVFERNHTPVQFLDRITQIILTPSFAFPIYWLLTRIDRWTHCEELKESGGVEL